MSDIDFISQEGQNIVNCIKQESNVDEQIHNLLVDHVQDKIPALLSTIGYINNEIHECFMNNRFWSTAELRILLKKARNTLLEGLDFPGATDFRKGLVSIDTNTISGMETLSQKINQHLQALQNGSSYPDPHEKKATLSYLNNLTITWNDIVLILDIGEEIDDGNYQEVFEEYKEYIFSHPKKIELQKIVNKEAGIYKTICTKKKRKHWIGECLLLLQNILNTVEKEIVPLSLEEQSKKLLLQQEIAYFPQIIGILHTFKETFSTAYFSKQPTEIKKIFPEQYTLRVLHPIMALHPDLFSFSDNEIKSLGSSHRKKELYVGIISLFENASEASIEKAIARNFFFGEIDDLMGVLEKMREENMV